MQTEIRRHGRTSEASQPRRSVDAAGHHPFQAARKAGAEGLVQGHDSQRGHAAHQGGSAAAGGAGTAFAVPLALGRVHVGGLRITLLRMMRVSRLRVVIVRAHVSVILGRRGRNRCAEKHGLRGESLHGKRQRQ